MKADLRQDINGGFAFMERFLEGSAPLSLNSEEKICICYSSHLGECANVLMEQFLQGNVPLRHLLNEESIMSSWLKSAIKEINNWALNLNYYQTSKILTHFNVSKTAKTHTFEKTKTMFVPSLTAKSPSLQF